METDVIDTNIVGLVRVLEQRTRHVLFHGQNAVTKQCGEVMLRALLGTDFIKYVVAANTGGLIPSSSSKSLPGVVLTQPVELSGDYAPSKLLDQAALTSVGVWRAIIDPDATTNFDTLGLLSLSGSLVAAVPVGPMVAVPGVPRVVEWTLALRGAGSYSAA